MRNTLMSITLFGLAMAVVFGPVSSLFENCFGERCFTILDSSETKNLSDAKNWCNKNASRLAVVNDNATQEALTMFLKYLQSNEQPQSSMFIDLQLKQKTTTWYLIDGTPYLGEIGNQGGSQYNYYCCLQYSSSKYYVSASNPNDFRNFVCKYEGTRCLNNSTDNCIDKGGCFVKYENETLNWYQARERCYKNGGDLATFNYNASSTNYPTDVPFNTSCLNQSLSYWVGIRYRDWRWISSDDSNEAIYTWWSNGEPSNRDYECVCVDPEGTPAWSWTDCNCSEQRQFICLKTLAIGLGVGIGGGVFIAMFIVIIVLAVTLIKKREIIRKNKGKSSTVKTAEAHMDRRTSELEAASPDGHYQHLQKETGSETSMPFYEQLNQPESQEYELNPHNI